MLILGVETSHDDTSLALVKDKQVIQEYTISQTEIHKKFGGTIPELASRNHVHALSKILDDIKKRHDLTYIDHIAYTSKPGLMGSLQMGKVFAQALGFALNKNICPINHISGHIFSVEFNQTITFPALALIVSGGHTQLILVNSYKERDIVLLGETRNDALGEVFDKLARYMELGFPGGPLIDKLAKKGQNNIPLPISHLPNYDFSFSGLKTCLKNMILQAKARGEELNYADLACSFQFNVVDQIKFQVLKAIDEFKPKSLILGGGVSANSFLRSEVATWHENVLIPEMRFTTDNASMIALTSYLQEKYN